MTLLHTPEHWTPRQRITPVTDGAIIELLRRGKPIGDSLRIGPNEVHAWILRPDASIEDLGVSHNLLTNAGRDLVAAAGGAAGINNGSNVATATSSTSLTDSGESWTTDQFKGWIVIAEESTNTPVFGNIVSNTGTVLTIDSWKNADDSAGTTPGSTANYHILPAARFRYMGVTADTGAANAANTTLASEISNNGLARALITYAHTNGTATATHSKAFSVSGGPQTVHRMALFTSLTGAGVMGYESVLNADAIVGNGDTLTITDTITYS